MMDWIILLAIFSFSIVPFVLELVDYIKNKVHGTSKDKGRHFMEESIPDVEDFEVPTPPEETEQ